VLNLEERIRNGILGFANRRHSTLEKLSSGIPSFDLIEGGIPKGRITEVYDVESSTGKTSFALQYAKTTTNSGKFVLYFSIEQKLTKYILDKHSIDKDRIAVCTLGGVEDIISITKELSPDLVIVDSLAAVVPEETQYRYILLRKMFREVNEVITESNTAALFLNQSRVVFKKKVTVGGSSIEDWADLRIKLHSGGLIFRKFVPVGRIILMDLVSKTAPITRSIKTSMMFDTGYDTSLDLLDLAVKHDIILREGVYYRYHDLQLGAGRDSSAAFLKNNPPVYSQVYEQVLKSSREDAY
jgi:recombination protein RecA